MKLLMEKYLEIEVNLKLILHHFSIRWRKKREIKKLKKTLKYIV